MDRLRGALNILNPSNLRTWLEDQRGWKMKNAALAEHFYRLIVEQVMAIVPISILLVLVMAIFFGRTVASPVELAMGILAAIIGLAMFIDALRVCVMPLSEQLGTELPKTLSLPYVLMIAGFLGILVTYAEPAITTLRPLAKLVDPEVAPYLYCVLMEFQELLVFCVGLGVGCAATLGTLRFVKGWSLKPLILGVLAPTLGCTIYMWWGNEELRPLLGLAWDCGAVTTGPVTVPVLLALGIGVMKTKREQDKAKVEGDQPVDRKEVKHQNTKEIQEAAQDALEGFGIVTLASLMPVLAVQILSISLSFIYTNEDIIARVHMTEIAVDETQNLLDMTPVREIYFSARAILPLVVCLILIVTVILKKPVPKVTFYLKAEEIQPRKSISRDRTSLNLNRSLSRSISLRAGARRSMEYGRALLRVKKAAATGSLTVWSQTLTAAVALGTAEADAIKFKKGEIDRNDPNSNAVSHDNLQQTEAEVKVDSADLAKLEAAFSGELYHGDHFDGSNERAAPKSPSPSQYQAPNSDEARGCDAPEVDDSPKDATPPKSGSAVSPTPPPPIQKEEIEITVVEPGSLGAGNDQACQEEEPGNGVVEERRMPDIEFGQRSPFSGALVESSQEPSAFWNWITLFAAIAEALFGMILFSLGLTFGFTSIGDQVGTLLPAAFIVTEEESSSPYYDYGVGVLIALGTMFALGFMATRAEPALNVVGQTVEKLSKGSFTCNMLVYSVCVGVGLGMCMGATKILFGFPLIWFILFKYVVALGLSALANEDFINIAWDSAGVTTGPVTVPFVLSVGVGCSKAVKASEGFGILACASVWPIITVLVVDGIRRAIRKARAGKEGPH